MKLNKQETLNRTLKQIEKHERIYYITRTFTNVEKQMYKLKGL